MRKNEILLGFLKGFQCNEPFAVEYILGQIDEVVVTLTTKYCKIFMFDEDDLKSDILCTIYEFIKKREWNETNISFFDFNIVNAGETFLYSKVSKDYIISPNIAKLYVNVMEKLFSGNCDIGLIMQYEEILSDIFPELIPEEVLIIKNVYKKINSDRNRLKDCGFINTRGINMESGLLAFDCKRITDYVEKLPPKQQLVIILRFGLDGEGERTFSDISKTVGVSVTTIRQEEAKALRKLRYLTNKSKEFTDIF